DVNPRDVNDGTKVYKRIEEGLTDSTQSFFVNNRGILISAKSVAIDALSKEITLDLGTEDEKEKYGVLDGGHTYYAIIKNKDNAIAELTKKFGSVKRRITNETSVDDIAYRDNEDKRLDTVDLIRLMFTFNVFKFAEGATQPIQAYSGKAQVLKDYLANYDKKNSEENQYEYIAPLLPTIIKLYDRIESE